MEEAVAVAAVVVEDVVAVVATVRVVNVVIAASAVIVTAKVDPQARVVVVVAVVAVAVVEPVVEPVVVTPLELEVKVPAEETVAVLNSMLPKSMIAPSLPSSKEGSLSINGIPPPCVGGEVSGLRTSQ